VSWEIVAVADVDQWLARQDADTFQLIAAALDMLAEKGPGLGRPMADTVKGSRHKNMKELRPGSSGRGEVRILFAFDPDRKAILLVAGDKAGDWNRWYDHNIALADNRFDDHLAARAQHVGETNKPKAKRKRGRR